MTIPYVKNPTWADGSGGGTPINAAKLNAIESGIFDAQLQPAVHVFHDASQNILTGTATALALNSEQFDTASNAASTMHDGVTNNTRLTNRYAGIYQITGMAEWASNPANATIRIRLNGTTYIAYQQIVGDFRVMNISVLAALAVNDYVELVVSQASGSTIAISSTASYSPEFMMVRVA